MSDNTYDEKFDDVLQILEDDDGEDVASVRDGIDQVGVHQAEFPSTKAGMLEMSYEKMSEMKRDELKDFVEEVLNSDINEEEGEKPVKAPRTKLEMIKSAYDKMKKMKKENLKHFAEELYEMDDHDEDHDEDHDAVSESFHMEGLANLMESEGSLSEDFKEKAQVIFEAAVNDKVRQVVARKSAELNERFESELVRETETILEDVVEKVDSYLDYVVSNWMEENKLAIESGIRNEIAESFMTSLKGVFDDHYIEVPESKVDVVEEMTEEVASLRSQINTLMEKNIDLNESVKEQAKAILVSEHSRNMSMTQAHKLASLVEDVEFVNEADFVSKLETLKEAYFDRADAVLTRSKKAKPKSTLVESLLEHSQIIDDADFTDDDHSALNVNLNPKMQRYLSAFNKK